MPESFLNDRIVLHCGDCLEVMATLPENSVDACVTDPPYHLTSIVKRMSSPTAAPVGYGSDGRFQRVSGGFMGQLWDGGDIAFKPETWAAVYRVLKPGAHLLAFGGTRTFHRMACAIEDAGFEVRDCISWNFGSGFPKSHSIDKVLDAEEKRCSCPADLRDLRGGLDSEKSLSGNPQQNMRPTMPSDSNIASTQGKNKSSKDAMRRMRSAGLQGAVQSEPQERRAWDNCGWCGKPIVPDGFGTALKPAMELICLARKPLSERTVASNVLRWGTGAINVDGCRIGIDGGTAKGTFPKGASNGIYGDGINGACEILDIQKGRWPANLIHDGSEEVLAGFPESGPASSGGVAGWQNDGYVGGKYEPIECTGYDDNGGSAARFFYTAKADSDDRIGSKHPTVKPLDLIQYLCRLITPPKGVILDPFAGTGTTGEAAWREGFNAVLIEREAEYQADIRRRMALCLAGPDERARESLKAKLKDKPLNHGPLFGGSE